jgi:hypothetical protein
MSKVTLIDSTEAKTSLHALFEEAPILIEVRFPGCGTSPDWYLISEEEELDGILAKLAPGAELHLNRVWDLKNPKGAICLRKGS